MVDRGWWRVKEVSDYLGVSRLRVDQLVATGGFPTPSPVGGVRLWKPTKIETWAEANWWGTMRWRVRPDQRGRVGAQASTARTPR
jgi:excisionase family DNA binding protein